MTPEGTLTPAVVAAPRAVDVARAAAWVARQTELALAELDLSLPQYRMLGLLHDHGAAVSSKLASDLVVRPPSVTAVVDGLVARGCVTRRHADDDRRRVSHDLTSEGRALLERADEAVNRRLGDIAASLDDPDASRRAMDSLVLWRSAIRAYKRSQ